MWKEDAERYRILVREIPEEDQERIIDKLTDRRERILFGLEVPEEPKGAAAGFQRRRSELPDLWKERPDKAGLGAAHGAAA
jgi:hypothetical protein